MARIFVTRTYPAEVLDALSAHEVTLRDKTTPASRETLIAALREHDAILPTLGDLFTADLLKAAGPIRARLLANFGAGYNHIDAEAARAHGLAVTNTPGVLTDATADLALTLILATARRAGEGERMLRAGDWQGWHPTQLLGTHVTGKTVGIIGMGRIGAAIARRCHFGFGMEVVFYNRSPKTPDVPARQWDSIGEVAEAADFVVIAVPGGAETRHLIGAETLAAMGPRAILVNIARGDVVDEAALIAALKAGRIAGAGLDVYEREPEVPEALRRMENVTLLPHLGSATLETRVAMGLKAVENILAFFDGKPLVSPV